MERLQHLSQSLLSSKAKAPEQPQPDTSTPNQDPISHNPRRSKKLNQIEEDTGDLLNRWRSDAKIDPNQLRLGIWGDDYKDTLDIWEMCRDDPELNDIYYFDTDRDEYRKKCLLAYIKIFKKMKCTPENYIKNFRPGPGVQSGLAAIDAVLAVRFGVHVGLYVKTMVSLGTERHMP